MNRKRIVRGYRATIEAAKGGLLLGGVKTHVSVCFCSASAATRWAVIVASTNKRSGRAIAPLKDVEEVMVSARHVVHGCSDGSSCSLRDVQGCEKG